jgi:hypothetical protein
MEKLKALRWLGTSGTLIDERGRAFADGIPSGCLNIGAHVYAPGDQITDQEDLAQLGASRIEELILLGQAQDLHHSPKPREVLRGEYTERDRARAEEASRLAEERSRFFYLTQERDAAEGFGFDESGNPTAKEKARRATMSGGA